MGVQNSYNNYIKRQSQKPINNFKEKVKNSFNGVSTQKTVGNTASTPKQQINTTLASANNTNPIVTTPAQTSKARQITTPQATSALPMSTTAVANNVATPVTNNVTTPVENPLQTSVATDGNVTTPVDGATALVAEGLIPIGDVRNAYSALSSEPAVASASVTPTSGKDPNSYIVPGTGGMTRAEYEAEIKRKQQAGQKLDKEYIGKTPEELANENLYNQSIQSQKDYEMQQQLLEEQKKYAEEQHNISKQDAEKVYQESIDTLYKSRYDQMEDLNVSGTNRGIQYSPQQLGLENVVNINTNNNITKAGQERMTLLTKLQSEYNKLLSTINSSGMNALSEYQNAVLNAQKDYNSQLMDWSYNDKKTEEERKWQEYMDKLDKDWQQQQTQSDRDWQKEWLKYQLELEKQYQNASSGSKSYSSGSGYSRSYTPYSSSYTPYSSSYTPYSNNVDTDDEITQQAIDNTFKQLSTASYNAVNVGRVDALYDNADIYNEFIDPMYSEFYGQNDVVDSRLDNTRETALKHLFNRTYERSTNSPSKIGDTLYQNRQPLRQSYIDKVKQEQLSNKGKYFEKYSNDSATKSKARLDKKVGTIHESIMNSKNTKTNDTKVKSSSTKTTSNKSTTKTTTTKKSTNTTKNAVKNSISNAKKNTSTTKKTTKDVKVNTKAVSKSASNLKKTVSKIKDKIKKLFK